MLNKKNFKLNEKTLRKYGKLGVNQDRKKIIDNRKFMRARFCIRSRGAAYLLEPVAYGIFMQRQS